jgi:prolyl 4-hydroxylase
VLLENGTTKRDEQRTSNTAFLPRPDPMAQCILERAAQLQGFMSMDAMEDLQLTAYDQGQQYRPHYDWFLEHVVPSMGNQNRGSTFFVTLDADCENCGTQFPRVGIDWRYKDPRWCEFVDCENIYALTVKARPGSAVFWQNLDAEGYGNPKTMHAGLPVPEGKKIGMNIWTRVTPAWAVGAAMSS